MKKGDFVIIATGVNGLTGIYPFGKDKSSADYCYKAFVGDTVTLYVVNEIFIGDIYLEPIKSREEK